ncbi:MAG: hypothetical protein IJJ41_00435 [Clostridia bacterium]|nr:hypothetical protein [Clostridia bacterium]
MAENNQNIQSNQVFRQAYVDPTREVMGVGAYIGMFILSAIPIVNIICWIVWLISPNTNRNKKNYIIANIVLWFIGVLIVVIVSVILAAMGVNVKDALAATA